MKRGPTSAAALTVISGDGIVSIRRPDPPDELTEEQADEWRAVVNRMAADWFPRETHGLLAQYCRHIVASRHVAQLIAKAESDDGDLDIRQYNSLLMMQGREGRAATALARAMRLTQQSTYSAHKTKPQQAAKPWQK